MKDMENPRASGFFFTVKHAKEGEITHFILGASCARCGYVIKPDGKLDMILPQILKHSTECFMEASTPEKSPA